MDDNQLENQSAQNDVSSMDNPDYLQERSEIVSSLEGKIQNAEDLSELKYDQNISYTEKAKKFAIHHITKLEKALAEMRQRGDYGTTGVDSEGHELEGDMPFLEKKAQIPPELKREMEKE